MNPISTPIAVSFSYSLEDGSLAFVTREGICKVRGDSEKITSILKYCNGRNTIHDISDTIDLKDEEIVKILDVLVQRNVVIESRSLYKVFHQDASNVSPFRLLISPEELASVTEKDISKVRRLKTNTTKSSVLDPLFAKRDTTRDFSTRPLTSKQLFFVLEHMYKTEDNMAVPSPGSIYPTSFFVVILKPISLLKQGLYRYDYQTSDLIYMRSVSKDYLKFCLDNTEYVETASVILFLTVDLAKITKKYANRGYYFSLIETGHIAQNIQLVCAEQNIGVLEYGALMNEMIDRIIRNQGEDEPTTMLALLLGNKSVKKKTKFFSEHKTLWHLVNNYVGEDSIIKDIDSELLTDESYMMPRHAAFCSYASPKEARNKRKGFAFATDYSRRLALIKSMAEAIERYFSGELVISRTASYSQLKKEGLAVLDPRKISYTREGHYVSKHEVGLVAYSPELEKAWIEGVRLKDKTPNLVLVEQCFYPLNPSLLPGKQKSFKANSTGVAAGLSEGQARQHAIYELIERDAFSIFWYSQPSGKRINFDTLPKSIKERAAAWQEQGSTIDVLDISVDGIPVALVTLHQNKFPFFATGCAAKPTFEEALTKALDELEATAISWMDAHYDIDKSIKGGDVQTPRDHGVYYASKFNRSKPYIDILKDTPIVSFKNYSTPYTVQELIDKYDPTEIVLHKPTFESDFWVIRLLSPNLVMLNFGQGNEPIGHPRLLRDGRKLRWSSSPPLHFFP